MSSGSTHPAIIAGLAGATAWAQPASALAAELGGGFSLTNPGASFVAGCLVGAVVASGTSAVMTRVLNRRDAEKGVATGAASAASVQHASVVTTPPMPAPSTDIEDVAQSYVRTRTLAKRMAARAKGVADVLSERLSASRMEGLPVIERADGSVADLGESWWDDTVGEKGLGEGLVAPVSAPAPYAPVSAAPGVGRRNPAVASRVPAISAPVPSVADAPPSPAEPFVYGAASAPAAPEPLEPPTSAAERTSDMQREDLWAVALAALDEKFEEQIALGPDAPGVGFVADDADDADALDEPEGLEPATRFMPFRPQAGHPEVDDTDSYVSLLIDQEFARNRSEAARDSAKRSQRSGSHDYLKVIDGGTGDIRSSTGAICGTGDIRSTTGDIRVADAGRGSRMTTPSTPGGERRRHARPELGRRPRHLAAQRA